MEDRKKEDQKNQMNLVKNIMKKVSKIIWSCIFHSIIVGPAFSGPQFSTL